MAKDVVTTDQIVDAIRAGHRTAGTITDALGTEMRAVDRALQKAKREGRVEFDHVQRKWNICPQKESAS